MRDFRHGGRGRGRFGGGFGPGADFRSGRKLGAADLQRVVLALLEKQPAHGYELIREIEARSGGFYTPSPGVIYPALTYLDEIGHATADAQGSRKLYSLTDAGRLALETDRDIAERILEDLGRIGERMGAVRDAYEGRVPDDNDGEEGPMRDRGPMGLARRRLKSAMMAKRGCSSDETHRIADILERAAIEIETGSIGKKGPTE